MAPENKTSLTSWRYLRDFWSFLKPYKAPLRTVYILYFLNSLLNILPALSLRYYIDLVLAGNSVSLLGYPIPPQTGLPLRNRIWLSVLFLVGMAVLIIGANAIGVVMWRKGTRAVEQVIFDIKMQVHNHINKLSISFFNGERVGNIMAKAVGDVNNLGGMLRSSFPLIYTLVHFFLVPIIMLFISPVLFLVALLPTPLIFQAFHVLRKKLKPMYKRQRENESVISSQIQEVLSGIREIKAFNMEDQSAAIYQELNREYYDIANRIMKVFSFNHQLQYGAKDFGLIVIAVAGGIMVMTQTGGVTLGTITSFLLLSTLFYSPLGSFFGFFNTLQSGLVSLERILDFLRVVPDIKDSPHAAALDRKSIAGQVVFRNVSFSYVPGQPVLKNINFEVKPGEKLAVVGPTGSGKSTLLSLLLRFYDVDSGTILIDGRDIREFTQNSLRQSIGIVFQETFLFHGTIRENLAFANPDTTEEEMIRACRIANIYDTILEFPDQLDTMVGERGVTLSGGQKQRLAIARVILRDPAIVILDEATSAVDTVTENILQDAIDKLLQNRTAFIIAHRLSTLKRCHRILVLNGKEIAEMGTHEELLRNRGLYFELHEKNKF
jgi:ABC-type multidrug transport system fused ATPase/permease subunit